MISIAVHRASSWLSLSRISLISLISLFIIYAPFVFRIGNSFTKYFDNYLQNPLCKFCQNYNHTKTKMQLLKFYKN